MFRHLHVIVLAALGAAAPACRTTPLLGFSRVTEQEVDAGHFRVPAPAGDGWWVRVEPPVVRFSRLDRSFGRLRASWEILVAENTASPKAPRDPEAVADDFMSREAKGLRESRGSRLVKLSRAEGQVGDRRVHVMRYRVESSEGWRVRVIDGALHLWFPPDFATERRFFMVVTTGWKATGEAQAGLEVAIPVLAGIRREAVPAEEPPPPRGEAPAR